MSSYKFTTNINCGGCIEKVTPFMKANEGIKTWEVDTSDSKKILTVETDNLSSEVIAETVKKAGFRCEPVN